MNALQIAPAMLITTIAQHVQTRVHALREALVTEAKEAIVQAHLVPYNALTDILDLQLQAVVVVANF